MSLEVGAVAWDEAGLVPAIVQDSRSGRVLMLGWMSRAALERTLETGRVTFWSRSRAELWEKGTTSGHRLDLVSIDADCDGDALLVRALPHGPTCHTGTATCWGDDPAAPFAGLEDLWRLVEQRARQLPEGSYTARLVAAGPDGPGRKVVEEATEVLLAARDHAAGVADDRRLAEEAADLTYHLLVLLAERKVDPQQVLAVLAERRR
jgi:phosphoribosyl-ATP pyrophosphohydrolase/phosphoribosyl-AMP cyclohydrolase